MKYFVALASIALCISACSDDSCNIPLLEITPGSFNTVLLEGTGSEHDSIQVEYGLDGYSRGSGITRTFASSHTLTNVPDGDYDFYVRGKCEGAEWSEWGGPKSVEVN